MYSFIDKQCGKFSFDYNWLGGSFLLGKFRPSYELVFDMANFGNYQNVSYRFHGCNGCINLDLNFQIKENPERYLACLNRRTRTVRRYISMNDIWQDMQAMIDRHKGSFPNLSKQFFEEKFTSEYMEECAKLEARFIKDKEELQQALSRHFLDIKNHFNQ